MKSFTMTDLETRCKTSSEKIVSRTDFSRRQLATAFSPLKCLWAFSCHLKSLERRNKSLILLDSILDYPKMMKVLVSRWKVGDSWWHDDMMQDLTTTWQLVSEYCHIAVWVSGEEISLWGFVIIIFICFYRPRWSSWTCMEVYCGIFANASWCYALF